MLVLVAEQCRRLHWAGAAVLDRIYTAGTEDIHIDARDEVSADACADTFLYTHLYFSVLESDPSGFSALDACYYSDLRVLLQDLAAGEGYKIRTPLHLVRENCIDTPGELVPVLPHGLVYYRTVSDKPLPHRTHDSVSDLHEQREKREGTLALAYSLHTFDDFLEVRLGVNQCIDFPHQCRSARYHRIKQCRRRWRNGGL